MRRREVLAVVAGALAAPLAHAQQSRFFRIGYLEAGAQADRTVQELRRQFVLGLRDLGYIQDRHFKLEERYAAGKIADLHALAEDLVALPVDMIAANGEAPIAAAKRATGRLPIVMLIAADPVGSGFITSLSRPGGNITGMSSLTSDLASKRVELLKEIIPRATRVAVLWNPDNRSKVAEWTETQHAASVLGLTLASVEVRSPTELEPALSSMMRERPDALLTFTESLTIAFRAQITRFALANRLPMISALREFAEAGALAIYGTSRSDLWRRSASYVDQIARGANPADLPVQQPVRFELVVNLRAAKAIGVDVSPTLLTRADEVIE